MNIKRQFTKWYVKRGYTFSYDFTDVPVFGDDFMKIPAVIPKAVWHCPWWVKPFLFLFSPSVYTSKDIGKKFVDGFVKGLHVGMKVRENMPDEFRKLIEEDLYENNN